MSLLDVAFLEVIPEFVVHPRIERQLSILVEKAQHPETGVVLKTRMHHLKNYKKCFLGHELMTWIVQDQKTNIEVAVRVAQMMQKRKFIMTVGGDRWIQNDQQLYQFYDNDPGEEEIVNHGFTLEPPMSPRKRSSSLLPSPRREQRSSKRLSFSFKHGFQFLESNPSPATPKTRANTFPIGETLTANGMNEIALEIPENMSALEMVGNATITITGTKIFFQVFSQLLIVIEATSLTALPAVNGGGNTDACPYVKVLIGNTSHSTESVQNSLLPKWGNTFTLYVSTSLRTYLFDSNVQSMPVDCYIAVLDENRVRN